MGMVTNDDFWFPSFSLFSHSDWLRSVWRISTEPVRLLICLLLPILGRLSRGQIMRGGRESNMNYAYHPEDAVEDLPLLLGWE